LRKREETMENAFLRLKKLENALRTFSFNKCFVNRRSILESGSYALLFEYIYVFHLTGCFCSDTVLLILGPI
jgi:hypothetical protein